MELPIIISIIAILISIGSFAVTIWATRISNKSLNHTIQVQLNGEEKEFERLRADVLMQIADNRRILDKTRIEIGTIKAGFDAESQPVKVLMSHYNSSLFEDYLPRVETAIKELDQLWQDVSSWTKEKDYKDLIDSKSVLYRNIKDDEVVYDSGRYMINEFKTKLALAKEHVSGAVR